MTKLNRTNSYPFLCFLGKHHDWRPHGDKEKCTGCGEVRTVPNTSGKKER